MITDGEQRKYHNFWTYCVQGLPNTAPDGFKIPFAAGHTRRMLRLTGGPFRYQRHADSYLDVALRYAHVPVKQAVISPSALESHVPGRRDPRLLPRAVHRRPAARTRDRGPQLPAKGAHKVQIDFTEGRLAVKIDPSGHLLHSFIDLNNLALARFSAEERQRIGVHTCPGGDRDSTHSADVDYAELLPSLFELKVRNFYIALAGETRSRPRPEDHPEAHEAGSAGLRWRRRADRPARRDAGGNPRPHPRSRQVHSRSSSSAPLTTAASRPSATTPRPRATRRSPRSAHACSAPRSRQDTRRRGMNEDRDEEELLRVRDAAECQEHFPRAPACRGRAGPDEGSAVAAIGMAAGHARQHRRCGRDDGHEGRVLPSTASRRA